MSILYPAHLRDVRNVPEVQQDLPIIADKLVWPRAVSSRVYHPHTGVCRGLFGKLAGAVTVSLAGLPHDEVCLPCGWEPVQEVHYALVVAHGLDSQGVEGHDQSEVTGVGGDEGAFVLLELILVPHRGLFGEHRQHVVPDWSL